MFDAMAVLHVRIETDRLLLLGANEGDLEALTTIMPDGLRLNPTLPTHPALSGHTARDVAPL